MLAGADGDSSSSLEHQLLLNLQALGFDPQVLVAARLPSGARVPKRYTQLALSAEALARPSPPMVELLLFFLLRQQLPWPAVAAAVRCGPGVPADQQQRLQGQLQERAEAALLDIDAAFPCAEPAQPAAFKRAAAELLDCCRHLAPREMGNPRRLLSDMGQRVTWVCLRLSAVALRFLVSGRVPAPDRAGEGAGEEALPEAQRNVLRARLVRETMRWRDLRRAYAAADEAAEQAALQLAEQLATCAAARSAFAAAQTTRSGEDYSRPPAAVAQAAADHRVASGWAAEVLSRQRCLEEVLRDSEVAASSQVTRAEIEEAWCSGSAAVPGGGRPLQSLCAAGAVPGAAPELDLEHLARLCAEHTRAAAEAAGAAAAAEGPARGGAVAACAAHLEPLRRMLQELRESNAYFERATTPSLHKAVGELRTAVAEHSSQAAVAAATRAAAGARRRGGSSGRAESAQTARRAGRAAASPSPRASPRSGGRACISPPRHRSSSGSEAASPRPGPPPQPHAAPSPQLPPWR
eukprot:TRINITY_DN7570_c1_g1_i1.p2 TRINITY_DN7570_c1_g1~~TRINITY_DN7570_c1_g1_i1.p2  ORF type:complete len:565 (+),score=165.40 TRINITY_DN7570_c1_g1_i1:130-1695(+)